MRVVNPFLLEFNETSSIVYTYIIVGLSGPVAKWEGLITRGSGIMERRDYYFDRIDFEGKTVLDAGTGDGAALPLILERKPAEIFAVDKEASQLSEAKEKIPEAARDTVSFVECNISSMDFLDADSIDIAVINYWIGRVRQKPPYAVDYLKEIHRVLKPGGVLTILDESPDDFARYDERFIKYLNAADAICIFLGEETWRDYQMDWMAGRVEEAGFVIEDSILHEEGCTDTGEWLKMNIKGQIEEAGKIKEEKIGKALAGLLRELDACISPEETFWMGTEYSILARKNVII
ncbi:MAG: class I SAM-dependent methyltransferase [Planctomycetota bacterium]|nr:MAG: class I SAM-dependent methyltransferase [Planctomycetota bacterium]